MSVVKESSKLLTNKYFLYFIVFLASTNVLGYMVTNKINAIIFFILVSILTYQFSKNMAVIMTEFHEVMCNWGAKPLVIDLPAHIVLDHSEESSPVTIESPKSLNPWGAAAP